jgi:CHASE1-domain containing sensor protein
MLRNLVFVVASAAALILSTVAFAQTAQYGTAEEARVMLEKAVAAVKADKTKALDIFNRGEGVSRTAIFMCSAPTPRTAFRQRIRPAWERGSKTSKM